MAVFASRPMIYCARYMKSQNTHKFLSVLLLIVSRCRVVCSVTLGGGTISDCLSGKSSLVADAEGISDEFKFGD
jgi:hypothetical protein